MFKASETRISSGWAKPRTLALGLVLVVLATVASLLALQRYSTAQYRLALETDELGLAAYELSAAGLRVALTHQPAIQPLTQEQAADAAEARIALARSLRRVREDAQRLNNVPLQGRVEQFSGRVFQLQAALQDGNFADVPAIEDAVTAEFVPLSLYIRESSHEASARAQRAQTFALGGRLTVVLVATVSLAVIYNRYRKVQRAVERAEAEQEALRHSEARFRPLVQSSSDVIAVIDSANVVTYVSPAVERITGMTPEQLTGRPAFEPVGEREQRLFDAFLLNAHRRPGEVTTAEFEYTAPDGVKHLELVCTNLLDDADVRGLVLNIRDVTERKQLEQQLRFQAFHDALTGLANGKLLTDRLEQGLQRTSRTGRGEVSVIYLDLDRFKEVNDEFGHQVGDDLLREVANRLSDCIRTTDTASRLGGDEFAILIEDRGANNKARDIADRVLKSMSEPFLIQGREVTISASIGVVVADPSAMTAGDVLRNADLAMYDAKHHGRNRVHHFQPAMLLALTDLDSDEALQAVTTSRRHAA